MQKIEVDGNQITLFKQNDSDYISLTDMAKSQHEAIIIAKWLSLKNTIEYLGAWETMYNPDFNYTDFGLIRNMAGSNNFVLSTKEWIEKTGAIGINAKTGRYGGTYAHKDIAFQFGMWISPRFQLMLVKEFQRLKELESNQYNLEWNFKRVLSKANYTLHTSAIKEYMLPAMQVEKDKEWIVYANEADLLNVALFGCTAKQWRENNPQLALQGNNIRDFASINHLAVLSNLESLSSILIKNGIDKKVRFEQLKMLAQQQMKALENVDFIKSYNKLTDSTYSDIQQKKNSQDNSTFDQKLKGLLSVPPPKKDIK